MATLARIENTASSPESEAADAYDSVGERYRTYADGEGCELFDFSSRYSFADREIWQRIDATLVALRASGQTIVKVVDAGCGPGTWLLRVVLRARALGFQRIDAEGFDISSAMIDLARDGARSSTSGIPEARFTVCDIEQGLAAYRDAPADLVLCLYGVLNHLPAQRHEAVATQLARAATGSLLVTARTIGSMPSIFVAGVEDAIDFRRDHQRDRLCVALKDGRHIEFGMHLFSASELKSLFAQEGEIAELVGVDLFHGRFAPDARWNPSMMADRDFNDALVRLEHLCACDMRFIDRAAHVLLHLKRGDLRV